MALRLRSELLASHEAEIPAKELRVDPDRKPGIGNPFHHLQYVIARCSVNFKACRFDELKSLFRSLDDSFHVMIHCFRVREHMEDTDLGAIVARVRDEGDRAGL